MVLTRDVNSAVVFDCRRYHIEERLEYLRLANGLVLQAEPVDPKEIHETCDGCGRSALSFQIFFDGEHYLCKECRAARNAEAEAQVRCQAPDRLEGAAPQSLA